MFKRLLSWFRKGRAQPAPAARPAHTSAAPARRPAAAAVGTQSWAAAAMRLGIDPALPAEQIRQQLAPLYRRYNRAAANLNADVRAEAEEMLDAIIDVRKGLKG